MLQRPWLTPFVVVFWCLTSGWLLVEKILPSLLPGSPPGHRAIAGSAQGLAPVAWTVQWNERPIGWAIAETERAPLGGFLVTSRMHFDRLPLDEVVPPWTRLLVRNMLPTGGGFTFDARGRLTFDGAGKLRSFMSIVNVPGADDQVLLTGVVDGGSVRVHVQAGELQYETSRQLPDQFMIGDELSPQATMAGLYEGRRWTIPVYSPLRAANAPIEILHAEVGPEETVYHDGNLVRAHIVAYREDPSRHRDPRCILWVDRLGRVLKQEAALLGSRLSFLRRSDDAAVALAKTLAEEGRVPDEQLPSTEAVP